MTPTAVARGRGRPRSGHIPIAAAGTEFVQFSPSLELQAVAAAMLKNMQAARS